MSDSPDTPRPDDATSPDGLNDSYDVVGEESDEVAAPRRAASAEFVVQSEFGTATAMRDAMDPANQSLADALRLSFRVLQLVILILIVLFLSSSVVTVQDTQSGVLTRWGRIVNVPFRDGVVLDPGFSWGGWPYPVGEFVLFETQNRTVDVRDAFLPNSTIRGASIQQHLESARPTDRYRAGVDGSLLTKGGDLVHVAFDARYDIVDAVKFVGTIQLEHADAVVKSAVERAAIRVVSTLTLQEIMDVAEDMRLRVESEAQTALDRLECGIRITQVSLPEEPRPPYQIVSTFGDVQEQRLQAEQMIQSARRSAEDMRNGMAGRNWRDIVEIIEDFETAMDQGLEEQSEQYQVAVNTWLDTKAEGMASKIISDARSYQSTIELTLGNEAKRFAAILPTYHEHPDMVIRQRWYQATGNVLSTSDAELFSVPLELGLVNISLSRLDEIAQRRRDMKLRQGGQQAWEQGMDPLNQYIKRGDDININGPGRRLDITDEGRVTGQAGNRTGTAPPAGGN